MPVSWLTTWALKCSDWGCKKGKGKHLNFLKQTKRAEFCYFCMNCVVRKGEVLSVHRCAMEL